MLENAIKGDDGPKNAFVNHRIQGPFAPKSFLDCFSHLGVMLGFAALMSAV